MDDGSLYLLFNAVGDLVIATYQYMFTSRVVVRHTLLWYHHWDFVLRLSVVFSLAVSRQMCILPISIDTLYKSPNPGV